MRRQCYQTAESAHLEAEYLRPFLRPGLEYLRPKKVNLFNYDRIR